MKADLNELMPLWADLAVPIYLIQGAEDNLVSPKELAFFTKMAPREMQHRYPHPGDHFIYWTDVPFVLDVIDDALKELSR